MEIAELVLEYIRVLVWPVVVVVLAFLLRDRLRELLTRMTSAEALGARAEFAVSAALADQAIDGLARSGDDGSGGSWSAVPGPGPVTPEPEGPSAGLPLPPLPAEFPWDAGAERYGVPTAPARERPWEGGPEPARTAPQSAPLPDSPSPGADERSGGGEPGWLTGSGPVHDGAPAAKPRPAGPARVQPADPRNGTGAARTASAAWPEEDRPPAAVEPPPARREPPDQSVLARHVVGLRAALRPLVAAGAAIESARSVDRGDPGQRILDCFDRVEDGLAEAARRLPVPDRRHLGAAEALLSHLDRARPGTPAGHLVGLYRQLGRQASMVRTGAYPPTERDAAAFARRALLLLSDARAELPAVPPG
ncbi:hypothetical protein [Marinitenerispora sediminis]|uniref:Uncharacterized protein n=1 Tax=Marinitenerispora sediminis TaxID=1931232 RepID=A0A368T0R6_9ACTN|nr:hypothetical protein [Marinitenerispora sediminis]RCV48458.1 hypothetical protein DEF28_23470 [Marinitenerispora sediminis]RCV53408.1 hypothetical protein DEF24_20700 [Marinitenerispora sediminis]RCV60608.1 hypothetical protein DEF23_04070 [Marinitenerispora sediminis]